MTSPVVPDCSLAHMVPVRPKPVRISSQIRRASASLAISFTAGRKSSGGITLPAVPCIGSMMIAATAPWVWCLMTLRRCSAQARPQEDGSASNGQR